MIGFLRRWLDRRDEEALLRRFGGVQRCPWCRRWVQSSDQTYGRTWERDQFLNLIHCGHCGGESVWKWEVDFIYVGPVAPPTPIPAATWYDIDAARLRVGATHP